MLRGTESAEAEIFLAPKNFFWGRALEQNALCHTTDILLCTLSPLDLAYRDYNVPTDLRNCWGILVAISPTLKVGGRSPAAPLGYRPCDQLINTRLIDLSISVVN